MVGLLSGWLQRRRMEKAIKFLEVNKVLDVGCGEGDLLRYFPKGIHYIGIDMDARNVFKAEELHPGVTFKWLNLNGFEGIDGFFDTIFMLAVVEHLDNPAKLVKVLARHLNPGGVIIITTPSSDSEWLLSLGSKLGIFNKEQIAQHEGLYSETELRAMAKCANLAMVHYSRFELGLNQLIVLRKGESHGSDAVGGLTSLTSFSPEKSDRGIC